MQNEEQLQYVSLPAFPRIIATCIYTRWRRPPWPRAVGEMKAGKKAQVAPLAAAALFTSPL